MKTKIALIAFLVLFVGFCSVLVLDSGLFGNCRYHDHKRIIPLASESPVASLIGAITGQSETYDFSQLKAAYAPNRAVMLGSIDPDSGYEFALELSSKGAGIQNAFMSGFDDRDPQNPQPLAVLSAIEEGVTKPILPLANGIFELIDKEQRIRLNELRWQVVDQYNKDAAVFTATLTDADGKDGIKLTKTYSIQAGSYDVNCRVEIENLSGEKLKAKFQLNGPCGIGREGARGDMRNIISAYMTDEGMIKSEKLDNNKMRKAAKNNNAENLKITDDDASTHFLWAATTNKYFAAILQATPDEGASWRNDCVPGSAQYYDSALTAKKPSGRQSSTFSLYVNPVALGEAGTEGAVKTYDFTLYLGPKDKNIFENDKNDRYNESYSKNGYFHTITFLGCCCPQAVINPMAFGIMATMKWMYGFIPNYGIVIIIFVVLVRLCLHPVTKKSQVSMMRMQKLAPKIEEIKKKHASNKTEMNKQVMQLYKDQGVSPVSSMLPMMIQMPIWISLYSAIYANTALRGAAFLPFWITDLSAPDALVRFPEFVIPLIGIPIDSFNLMPILLAVAMFMQQKLMSNPNAAASEQAAQQQKMMLIMMPIMMLMFLYKAPSGLNMYIMASTFAGVAEQIIIRKHIKEKEAEEAVGLVSVTSKTGGKVKKKKPKPFFKNQL
ncbi:MAG: YidC/Oxa1 family insertase periplasmic-domain containing protein [Planctomycetes bacterium]|nr:YidC/Oxa1 family insertase periplasmic-domain containing protein [Planctomycetota bacterium]